MDLWTNYVNKAEELKVNDISKINLSNISQHPGERLLRWMSIKAEEACLNSSLLLVIFQANFN